MVVCDAGWVASEHTSENVVFLQGKMPFYHLQRLNVYVM